MLKNLRLGQVLIETGYITEQQLEEALEYQKNSSMKKCLEMCWLNWDISLKKTD